MCWTRGWSRFARHLTAHQQLVAGLAELGLEMLVEPESRLPMLNAVKIPEGIDEAAVRGRLLKNHNIEIGAGLGPLAGKIWRIGLDSERFASCEPRRICRGVAAFFLDDVRRVNTFEC